MHTSPGEQTVKQLITEVEKRFGTAERIWGMDRGMISDENLAFLRKPGRKYRYPVAVREDGTISLPFVPTIHVADTNVTEAEGAVRQVYPDEEGDLSARWR